MKIWLNEIIEVLEALKIPYTEYSENGRAIRFHVKNCSLGMKEGHLSRRGNLTIEIDNYSINIGETKSEELESLEDKTTLYLTKSNGKDRVEFTSFHFTPKEMRGVKIEEIPNGYTLPVIFIDDYLIKNKDRPTLNKESWELHEGVSELKNLKPLY